MDEHEIESAAEAAFFLSNNVVNEYHGFPVVNRADIGRNSMFIQLNGTWYEFEAKPVKNAVLLSKLESLVE